MIVRCGRCKAELQVDGPGEFACPACGTRNVVRGAAAPHDPLGVPDLGAPPSGGVTGLGVQPPPPQGDPAPVDWMVCPACSYRFAVGAVEKVPCPTCGHELTLGDGDPADGS